MASLLTVFSSICLLYDHPELWDRARSFAGYSVGQFTALFAAKWLSEEQVFEFVMKRAQWMNECLIGKSPSGIWHRKSQ